ncbi:LytR family transcriptional regulator [Peptacetobacter hominis]|uniref:LytR family transcriptional regulator n=2 Tax=Peptacetobacter hominis TaxID=2743610 RepID=A0A544QTF4_9FIRM|nr:LytR family transcriptional regulator [Peptacetobacter hominis]
MSEAYDPSLVGGVFDNITHINKKGVTNILLLGSDAREGENDSRTDAMMIFTIDTVHNSLKLTSLARDAYVDIPGHGKTKLTHAYFYGGVELLTETIEDNFGIDIHNYALVDFESFMYIIDAVGGVSVEVKDSELDELNKFIPETYKWYKGDKTEMQLVENSGYQVLNGYQALSFARIRKNDSAFERDRRQRDVMQAMLTGIKSMSWFEYPKLMNAVLPYLKTNMKSTQIVSLGISVVRMGNLDIKQFEFPITDSPHSIEGIYGNAGWVIQFDDESVKILQDFIFEDIEYTGE